jgi:hypothetical protein
MVGHGDAGQATDDISGQVVMWGVCMLGITGITGITSLQQLLQLLQHHRCCLRSCFALQIAA